MLGRFKHLNIDEDEKGEGNEKNDEANDWLIVSNHLGNHDVLESEPN